MAAAMARRAEEETFRPRTHGEGRRDAGKRASLEKLAAPRTALWERSASAKKAKDEAVFAENCTFAPKVGRGPKTPSTKPAAERLYEYAEKRLETRERVQARVVEEEMELLTFKPTVNVRASAGIRDKVAKTPPLHQRVADVLRAKENVRTEARLKVEDELAKAHTFKPAINPTSVILAMQRAEVQKAMEDETTAATKRQRLTADDRRRWTARMEISLLRPKSRAKASAWSTNSRVKANWAPTSLSDSVTSAKKSRGAPRKSAPWWTTNARLCQISATPPACCAEGGTCTSCSKRPKSAQIDWR